MAVKLDVFQPGERIKEGLVALDYSKIALDVPILLFLATWSIRWAFKDLFGHRLPFSNSPQIAFIAVFLFINLFRDAMEDLGYTWYSLVYGLTFTAFMFAGVAISYVAWGLAPDDGSPHLDAENAA